MNTLKFLNYFWKTIVFIGTSFILLCFYSLFNIEFSLYTYFIGIISTYLACGAEVK